VNLRRVDLLDLRADLFDEVSTGAHENPLNPTALQEI
jgi:hypothetical protein